ncbi:MAG TPA: META domain-containing protein [Candidatus Limnocylindrales bacterium]|nr:META domain-containing protein [Candidatus Limnocylindrales bacterium]
MYGPDRHRARGATGGAGLALVALVALIALVALLAAGCVAAGPAPGLDGRAFVSTRVTEGGVERPLVAGTRIRLEFRDGRLGASAGCNLMGGRYEIVGGTLRLTDAATTDMGCDPERHRQDDWLFGFLGSSPTLVADARSLTLSAGDTVVELVDEEIAEPDLPLVGPRWTLETLIAGGTASSVPAGVVATLVFAPDGSLALETGCNSGGARYLVEGNTLRLTEVVTTKRGCLGAAGEVERAVLSVLQGDLAFEIDGSVLRLRSGAAGLDYRG